MRLYINSLVGRKSKEGCPQKVNFSEKKFLQPYGTISFGRGGVKETHFESVIFQGYL